MKNIALAADHGGYELKEFVAGYLLSKGYSVKDLGCNSKDSVDYPDYGHALANEILSGSSGIGFAFCGSANGISMSLNRHKGIRAAICWRADIASLAVQHNNANVCSMPGRFISNVDAATIVDAFLDAQFEGGRHQKRIEKIDG